VVGQAMAALATAEATMFSVVPVALIMPPTTLITCGLGAFPKK